MILTKHFERLEPDTFNGYQIKVTFRYSSFDKKEIDALEKILQDDLGELVIAKCEVIREVGETNERLQQNNIQSRYSLQE